MSAIGQKLAVVSLGMSCQSAWQIDLNVNVIELVSGDSVAKSRLPIDWLICSPDSVGQMLRSDVFFPPSREQFTVSPRPCWEERDVYFWHEFKRRQSGLARLLGNRFDIKGGYESVRQKYRYLAEKFRALKELERLVFVISNTQNNLTDVQKETGIIEYVLDLDEVARLCDECDRYFERRCEYLFVTYDERVRGHSDRNNLAIFKLEPDETEWVGDQAQWNLLLSEYFHRTR